MSDAGPGGGTEGYGDLADIRQALDRALMRLHLDADRRAWLRPIHFLRARSSPALLDREPPSIAE